jgi:hypothetical protein
MAVKLTPAEVAEEIRSFLAGSGGPWDWDDFCCVRIEDPRLDAIRLRCVSIRDEYPPVGPGYCSDAGRAVLAELADRAEGLAQAK